MGNKMVYHLLSPSLIYSYVHYSVILYGQGLLTYDVRDNNFTVSYETPDMHHVCTGEAGEKFTFHFHPHYLAVETDYTMKYFNGTRLNDRGWKIMAPSFINGRCESKTQTKTNLNLKQTINEKNEGNKITHFSVNGMNDVFPQLFTFQTSEDQSEFGLPGSLTLHDNYFKQDFTCTWPAARFHDVLKVVNERRVMAMDQLAPWSGCRNVDALITSDYAEKVADYKKLEQMKQLVEDEYKRKNHM